MPVGAVYDRALFSESTKYAWSQTAPTDQSDAVVHYLVDGRGQGLVLVDGAAVARSSRIVRN
jgi:hypothetical protein